MPTVAHLLSPAPATPPPAPVAAANPFDHFDSQGANPFDHFDAQPGYVGRIGQAIGGAIKQVGADIGDIYQKDSATLAKPDFNPVHAAQQAGASWSRYGKTVADIIGIPGAALHAAVSEPYADLMDKLPVPSYTAPSLSLKSGLHIDPGHQMTPEEAHRYYASSMDTGLSAIGAPEAKIAAVAERFGPAAAKVVAEAPREAVITPEGELTPDGREIAAQNGLHPDQVKAAYDHFDEVQAQTANDNPNLPPAEPSAMAVGDGLAHPPTDEPPPNGAPQEQPPGGAAPIPPAAAETPPRATQRLGEAQSEGVDLSKGQATQDFTTQEAEQTLRRMTGTEEGAKAQAFYAKQQQQIGDAVDRFKTALGNTDATAEQRGAQVQDALRTLRDQGKAGVTSFYEQAKKVAAAYGEAGSNLTKLDTTPILAKLRELFIDESVPDQVRKALKQQAAKYGLLGHDPTTVEGETTVKLKDQNGEPTGRITFTGPVEPLSITNAEAFRQKINSLYEADTSKLSQGLKPLIEDAVQQAVDRAAREGPGDLGKAYQTARKAHQQQLATFKAKDVVQSLVDWKKGTQTPAVSPDAVLGKILGPGPDSVTSLKKVRAVLLSSATDQSKAAWNAIQAHAVAKVFDKALVLNATAEGPVISGAKLNTAIQAFGVDKLKVLLPKDEFDQLMKLNRIIRNATVPIEGTVNRSGTAYTLMNFIAKQGVKLASVARFIPGSHIVGGIADAATHIVKSGQQSAKAAKTLKGIREYDLTQAANEDKASKVNAGEFVRNFITTARDPNIIAPILATSATQSKKDATP